MENLDKHDKKYKGFNQKPRISTEVTVAIYYGTLVLMKFKLLINGIKCCVSFTRHCSEFDRCYLFRCVHLLFNLISLQAVHMTIT